MKGNRQGRRMVDWYLLHKMASMYDAYGAWISPTGEHTDVPFQQHANVAGRMGLSNHEGAFQGGYIKVKYPDMVASSNMWYPTLELGLPNAVTMRQKSVMRTMVKDFKTILDEKGSRYRVSIHPGVIGRGVISSDLREIYQYIESYPTQEGQQAPPQPSQSGSWYSSTKAAV